MRYLLLIFLVSLTFCAFSQRIVVKGNVYGVNQLYQKVSGIKVHCAMLLPTGQQLEANPVYSAENGDFEFLFQRNTPYCGIRLWIDSLNQAGDIIEQVTPPQLNSFSNHTFSYSLGICLKAKKEEAVLHYYDLLSTSATRELEQITAQITWLKESSSDDKVKLDSLLHLLQKLEIKYDSVQLIQEANRLATIDGKTVTARTFNYLEKIESGSSINEAIVELNLTNSLSNLQNSLNVAHANKVEIDYFIQASVDTLGNLKSLSAIDSTIMVLKDSPLKIHPLEFAPYYLKKARLYTTLGKYIDALKAYTRAFKLQEGSNEPWVLNFPDKIEYALVLNRLGRFSDAIQVCRRGKSFVLESIEFYKLQYSQVELDQLVSFEFLEGIELDDSFERFRGTVKYVDFLNYYEIWLARFDYIEGEFLYQKHLFENSLSIARKNIQLDNSISLNNPLVAKFTFTQNLISWHNLAGMSSERMGQDEQAHFFYKKSLDILKNEDDIKFTWLTPGILCNQALLLKKQGKTSEAIKVLGRALEIQDSLLGGVGNHITHSNLGICYNSINDTIKALYHHKIALQNYENESNEINTERRVIYLNNVGRLHYLNHNLDSSEYLLKQAVNLINELTTVSQESINEVYYNYIHTLFMIGEKAYDTGSYKIAEMYFRSILDYHEEVGIYQRIGLCHYRMGNFSKAKTFLAKAASLSETYAEGQFLHEISLVYIKGEEIQNAKRTLKKLKKIDPMPSSVWINYALLYSKVGKKKKARSMLKKGIESGFDDLEYISSEPLLQDLLGN